MNVTEFINKKSVQLSFYLRGYWDNKIPHSELTLFLWDTLEEWTQIRVSPIAPYSRKERVFWHVIHQLHFWPADKLSHDPFLHDELKVCLRYLDGETYLPLDCIGIRP